MGYRANLMSLPKSKYLELKDKTEEELGKDFYFRDIEGLKELHEIGKEWDEKAVSCKKNFFTNEMGWESDMEFCVAEKELLLNLIDNYREKTANWYKKLQGMPLDELKHEMHTKYQHWNGQWIPYNISEDTDEIVRAWSYEYVVFELVRILKSFDFEKNVLIFEVG